MRNLTWLSGLCLVIAACTVHPVDSIDASGIPDGGPRRGVTGGGDVTGTAGTTASAGATGTAGAPGSSGAPGTAGASGTSGTSGTAGTAGAAGAGTAGTTGTSGTSGTSGATGTAGAGTAGTTGAGGAAGVAGNTGTAGLTGSAGMTGGAGIKGTDAGAPDAGVTCASIEAQYSATLAQDKQCNPTLDRDQCQQQVDSNLSCSGGCKTWVDSKDGLDDIRQQWQQAGCDKIPRACPAIACIAPGKGLCALQPGGGGVCTGLGPLPTPAAQ